MYVPHHDASLLPSELKTADFTFGSEKAPTLTASA